MKKYELTTNTIVESGVKLFQIRALVSFRDVDAGDLGGWVSGEKNLSQEDNAWVYDSARVYDKAWVSCNARVYDNALVSDNADLVWFSKVGSENGTLTAMMSKDSGIIVSRGCFFGTIDEFAEAVEKRHGTTQIGDEYRLLIQFIRLRMDSKDKQNEVAA